MVNKFLIENTKLKNKIILYYSCIILNIINNINKISYYNRYNATDLLEDLKRGPSNKFQNFCRMSATDFEYLIQKIGPTICKTDTNMRKCIPDQERLAVTLRFLATGDSFKSLSYLFKFSTQTVSRCVQCVHVC